MTIDELRTLRGLSMTKLCDAAGLSIDYQINGVPCKEKEYMAAVQVPMPGEDREPGKVRTTQKPKKDTGDKMGGLDDEEPEEDPEAVEKARKDLGRD